MEGYAILGFSLWVGSIILAYCVGHSKDAGQDAVVAAVVFGLSGCSRRSASTVARGAPAALAGWMAGGKSANTAARRCSGIKACSGRKSVSIRPPLHRRRSRPTRRLPCDLRRFAPRNSRPLRKRRHARCFTAGDCRRMRSAYVSAG